MAVLAWLAKLWCNTCLFFADETNVLGHQSTTLDVVADVRFRDVLSKASDHDCVVGWYISAFLLTKI